MKEFGASGIEPPLRPCWPACRVHHCAKNENLPILPESNRRCTFSLSVQTWPLMSMNRTLKSLRELPCTANIARSPTELFLQPKPMHLKTRAKVFALAPCQGDLKMAPQAVFETATHRFLPHCFRIVVWTMSSPACTGAGVWPLHIFVSTAWACVSV